MGFLYHAVRFPAITVFLFVNLWSQLKWMTIGALTRLGIYKPSPEERDDSSDTSNNYIFLFDGISPSLVPIPIQVVTAAIKSRVPVIQYRCLLLKRLSDQPRRRQQQQLGIEEEVEDDVYEGEGDGVFGNLCTICLESLEPTQQVRELSRCSHVFHSFCLDTWVDSGQISCPLCRSMLLPPKTNLSRCGGDLLKDPQLITG